MIFKIDYFDHPINKLAKITKIDPNIIAQLTINKKTPCVSSFNKSCHFILIFLMIWINFNIFYKFKR